MNFIARRKRKPKVFDMTAMIDVVFQLLIFFLFTSRFTETVRTPLDLPVESGDGAIDQPADLVVDVLTTGEILLDGKPSSLSAFDDTLQTTILKYGDPSLLEVLVRADQTAESGHVNEVVSLLAARNVRLWRLGTAVPAGEGR
ncbi:MAG: biopolymer transporter ExbD [Salinibacterium sp.]|nr:biopolymer transporter ExbD [Salinibacterium sp.]